MESVDVFIFVFCTTGVGKSSLIHRLVGESYDFKSWWNLKYIIIERRNIPSKEDNSIIVLVRLLIFDLLKFKEPTELPNDTEAGAYEANAESSFQKSLSTSDKPSTSTAGISCVVDQESRVFDLPAEEVQSDARVTDRHKKTETSGRKIPQPVDARSSLRAVSDSPVDLESSALGLPVEEGRKVQWRQTSRKHHRTLGNLVKHLETQPSRATRVGTFWVCLEKEFFIGEGSRGTKVYVGLSDDGFEVAVKCLPLDGCKELGPNEKEILNSPNARKEQHIVNYRFHTDNVDDENAYLVLDLCEESLKDYVDSAARTEEMLRKEGPTMIRQILYGLRALHCGKEKILHRDLKPSNILVSHDGEILLADFGISRNLAKEQTTYNSGQWGTEGWIATESLPTEEDGECLSEAQIKVRYKAKSDIQVAGMLCFYILTKGKHPYGLRAYRSGNIGQGKPVHLERLDDPMAKDLIKWMLQHDPKDRPGVQECLKHPYLLNTDQQFSLVRHVCNEGEVKKRMTNTAIVKQLNADPVLSKLEWKSVVDTNLVVHISRLQSLAYTDDVVDLFRFIHNISEYWHDETPPTALLETVGKPKEYFLKLFPTLPVVLHRIIRNESNWKERELLKQFF